VGASRLLGFKQVSSNSSLEGAAYARIRHKRKVSVGGFSGRIRVGLWAKERKQTGITLVTLGSSDPPALLPELLSGIGVPGGELKGATRRGGEPLPK